MSAVVCPTCGCETCLLFSTTFTQANSSTVAGFTEVAGDWEVSSNILITFDDAAIIICDTVSPTGHGIVSAHISATTTGGKARLIGSYVDDENYLYFEVHWTSPGGIDTATGRLFSVVGGVVEELGTGHGLFASEGTMILAKVCWNGTYANAAMGTGSTYLSAWTALAYTGTGTQAGFGYGTPAVGNFDDFVFEKHQDDAEDCTPCFIPDCDLCTGNPTGWQVTIPTLANDGCSDCASYAGTYTVTDFKAAFTGDCIWSYQLDDICGDSYFIVELQDGGGSNLIVKVILFTDSPSGGATWQETITGPCDGISFLALDVFGSSGPECEADGTQVIISVLF